MSLESGNQIGPYFIDREIGRGGMGVVYLARDPRLNRDVAIKALPEHMAADPARLERFRSEAKTLAQLNHPAVAGIHGLEEVDGKHYLILEYVEGESLTERLERDPPSVEESIELGIRIAVGIEAAHQAGVVHRDLKPDNIRITPDDEVKILDFGLAKMNQETSSISDTSHLSATMTSVNNNQTLPGVILGTAAYMSPEQARGRSVDKRTDVWSFGVLLFECLTGANPFAGQTASDSIGAVLHKDLDLGLLPADTPPAVRRVLQRCLARDRNLRFRDIGDVRLELELQDRDAAGLAAAGTHPRWPLLAVAAVALVAIAGWAFTGLRAPVQAHAERPLHLSIPLPPGMEIDGAIDISRDGKTVVFAARNDEEKVVYLRRLDEFGMREVAGSTDGENPVFSPDGEFIIFQARNNIFRASVAGGPPVSLTKAKWMTADWSEDGNIVFSEGLNSTLVSMPAGGGERTPLTDFAADGTAYGHVWPQRIRGTSKMLFTSWTSSGGGGARLLDLDTGAIQPLVTVHGDRGFIPPARWSASGHLIFEAFDAGLLVVPFDPESGQGVALGEAHPLLDGVFHLGNSTRSVFALSEEGTLVYAPGSTGGRRMVWVDANGDVELIQDQEQVQQADLGGNVSISPSGSLVVNGGGRDLVVVDLDRKLARRIQGDGNDLNAVLSPDGQRVFFGSNRDTRWSVWAVDIGASTEPELILQREENVVPRSIAPNGDLLFRENRLGFGTDLLIQPASGEIRPLAATSSNEDSGVFSTDGKWVAYDSDISGRFEVYVIRADGSGMPIQVSTHGGLAPKFGRSGQTLYFRRHRTVMRVGFQDGRPVGEAVGVFAAPNLDVGASYDISADESRMVAIQLDDESIPTELRVVTDFFGEIRAACGAGQR